MRLGPIARNRERLDEAIRARSHAEDRSAIRANAPGLPILASPVQGYLSQNTRPKKPGARPWMRHTPVHNGRRVSRTAFVMPHRG